MEDCTVPQLAGMEEYVCTRVAGHSGPCEVVHIDEDQGERSNGVTLMSIANSAALALVIWFAACCLWYAVHAALTSL